MTSRDKDETRRCMPIEEWPIPDQAAWDRAIRVAGPLDDTGLAAHWRPTSKRYVMDAYGRYLTFLAVNGWLSPTETVPERITLTRLRSYIDEISAQVTPATLAGRIRGLAEAMRVMAPGIEFAHLKRARYRLKAQATPTRDKHSKMVPAESLAQCGLELMQMAEAGAFSRMAGRACAYRDGLMILLLASRPLRRSNFAAMRLGQHITKRGDVYQLSYSGDETKNHRPYRQDIAQALTPFIDRYLEIYRPVLLKGKESDRMWSAMGGRDLTSDSIYHIITSRTKDAFGWALPPHMFRDCAVTSLGAENPDLVWVGMSLLHHEDPRTTEKYYDRAQANKAVADYQDTIRRKRQSLTRRRVKPQSSVVL